MLSLFLFGVLFLSFFWLFVCREYFCDMYFFRVISFGKDTERLCCIFARPCRPRGAMVAHQTSNLGVAGSSPAAGDPFFESLPLFTWLGEIESLNHHQSSVISHNNSHMVVGLLLYLLLNFFVCVCVCVCVWFGIWFSPFLCRTQIYT